MCRLQLKSCYFAGHIDEALFLMFVWSGNNAFPQILLHKLAGNYTLNAFIVFGNLQFLSVSKLTPT